VQDLKLDDDGERGEDAIDAMVGTAKDSKADLILKIKGCLEADDKNSDEKIRELMMTLEEANTERDAGDTTDRSRRADAPRRMVRRSHSDNRRRNSPDPKRRAPRRQKSESLLRGSPRVGGAPSRQGEIKQIKRKSTSPRRGNCDTDGKDDEIDRKDDPTVVDSGEPAVVDSDVPAPLRRSMSYDSKSTRRTRRPIGVDAQAKSKERRMLKSNKGDMDGMLARAMSVSVLVSQQHKDLVILDDRARPNSFSNSDQSSKPNTGSNCPLELDLHDVFLKSADARSPKSFHSSFDELF
jgi:hypothetical protein